MNFTWEEIEKKGEKKRPSTTIQSPYTVMYQTMWKKIWWRIQRNDRR
jgi:hypothetical protein